MEIIIEPRRIRRRHLLPIRTPLELVNTKDQTEERLDFLQITWTCQQGKVWQLPHIGDQHIHNLVPWMRRRGLSIAPQIIEKEIERRRTGTYGPEFASLVEQYEATPEIWRLKVER